MVSRRSIPSDEQFEAARAAMAARSERERALRDLIVSRIPDEIAFHDVWIWITRDRQLHMDFVFPRDVDLEASETNNARRQVESAIRQASESFDGAEVDVSYHSHEEVKRKFNGNYFMYFR